MDLVITLLANHGEEPRQTLTERELISSETSNEPTKLVDGILLGVKSWPAKFQLVLNVFEVKCNWSKIIVEKLRRELKLLKGSYKPSLQQFVVIYLLYSYIVFQDIGINNCKHVYMHQKCNEFGSLYRLYFLQYILLYTQAFFTWLQSNYCILVLIVKLSSFNVITSHCRFETTRI